MDAKSKGISPPRPTSADGDHPIPPERRNLGITWLLKKTPYTLGRVRGLRWARIPGCDVTKFAPHLALNSISRGKLTIDERGELLRVDLVSRLEARANLRLRPLKLEPDVSLIIAGAPRSCSGGGKSRGIRLSATSCGRMMRGRTQTFNPKPKLPNPKPQTPNPEP